tara:strand:- start:2502 stop:2834 length:333 start_codon:yes stop_codon:yes gene_type:complete
MDDESLQKHKNFVRYLLKVAGRMWVFEAKTRMMLGEMTKEDGLQFVWDEMNNLNDVGTQGAPFDKEEMRDVFRAVVRVSLEDWGLAPKKQVLSVVRNFPGSKVEEIRKVG